MSPYALIYKITYLNITIEIAEPTSVLLKLIYDIKSVTDATPLETLGKSLVHYLNTVRFGGNIGSHHNEG